MFELINKLIFLLLSNNDLSVFSFRNNSSTAQYSMNSGSTWTNFKNPTGTRSITTNGTYDVTNYASASVNVSTSLSETTLWTNSSPSSSFSDQDVDLVYNGVTRYISNYTYIKIKFYRATDIQGTTGSVIISSTEFPTFIAGGNKMSPGITIINPSGVNRYCRPIWYISDSIIHFGNCTRIYGTETANVGAIPYQIIGLK